MNGASFAEDALLAVVAKNRFTAFCSTYCEVWHLTRNTFQELTNEFPSVQDQLGIMKKRSARYNPSANRRTMNMGDEKLDEEDAGDKLTTYLHPDSKWMKIWPFVMLFFLVYNIIVIPFRIAFRDGAGVGVGVGVGRGVGRDAGRVHRVRRRARAGAPGVQFQQVGGAERPLGGGPSGGRGGGGVHAR